jgi:hypothetical protein
LNEVVEGPLERLSRVAQAPYPPVARHAEETTHGARLVTVVDDYPPHFPAAFAGSWVDRVLAELRVLCPADVAAAPAFSSPVYFGEGRAGDIKDACLSAALAEHALFNLNDGTLRRPAAAYDEVSD